MPPEPSDIDTALRDKLVADATLRAVMPDGVFWNVAASGAKRFVILAVIDSIVEHDALGAVAHVDTLYQVEARGLSTTDPDMRGAIVRINELLDTPAATLTVAGFELIALRQEAPTRGPEELDDVDPKVRWYRRGGHYRVVMTT